MTKNLDLKTIETFLSQVVALKNTNKYLIAEKVELYIRARKQELEEGLTHSELEVTPTENIEMAVVPTEVEDAQSDDKKKTTTRKPKAETK
jgi:hypothetical protein